VHAATETIKNVMALAAEGTSELTQSLQTIVKRADELYQENDIDQLYSYMKLFAASNEAEIQWRLARSACDKAKATADKAERKNLMYEAFAAAELALKFGEANFACHKWYAILLDYIGEYEGTKERIAKAFKIKEHFQKAIELNPKDATSVHLLGYWCFVFADMPWYQQKVAAVIFATPPTSTYEEALNFFLEAEKIDPGFYSTNLLMIGKIYHRMKNSDLAKQYLLKARDSSVRTEDDKKAHKEAVELLQSLGVK